MRNSTAVERKREGQVGWVCVCECVGWRVVKECEISLNGQIGVDTAMFEGCYFTR